MPNVDCTNNFSIFIYFPFLMCFHTHLQSYKLKSFYIYRYDALIIGKVDTYPHHLITLLMLLIELIWRKIFV